MSWGATAGLEPATSLPIHWNCPFPLHVENRVLCPSELRRVKPSVHHYLTSSSFAFPLRAAADFLVFSRAAISCSFSLA